MFTLREGFKAAASGTRAISKVIFKQPSAYANNEKRKAEIVQKIKEFCFEKGWDAQGAEIAWTSTEHEGRTDPSEANHVAVQLKDNDGEYLTQDHKGKPTKTFHVYV